MLRINPEEVDYYNAHATLTPAGDESELEAIQMTFGDSAETISISSTKSMTGHLLEGAGAIEAVIAIKAVENNIVPPTINLENPDSQFALDLTPNQAKNKNIRVALLNSSGFGGTNSTLAFKSWEG